MSTIVVSSGQELVVPPDKVRAIVGISLHRDYIFAGSEAPPHMAAGEIEERVRAWLLTPEGQTWVDTLCKAARGDLKDCELCDAWAEVSVAPYTAKLQATVEIL